MPQLPVILTAFAQSPSGTYLAALGEEQKQIQAALQPATDSGSIQFVEQVGSRNEDIPQLLAKHPNQVSIFHFGGHADSDSLSAEDGSIFVEGLADQLATQSQLKLVFLNGCQTQAQVQHFFRQGIPLVLATTCSIADGEASYFAAQFYSAIAGRHSIREAFQLAVGALKAKYDQYRGAELPAYRTVRGVRLREQQWSQVPWQLYVQEGSEEVLEWQLRYPRGLTRLPSLHLETDCLGRETELEALQTLLHESGKVVLVSGLGGMGKTTLAAGYLQWLRNDYDYIAWINSSDDLMSSFALNEDLAKNLELPFIENEKIEDRFARLMNKLRNQPGRNLLVIDDVGDQVSEIAGQLPSGANWQVLVTSRLPLPDFREMKLGVLQASDALRLFRLHFQEGTDEDVQDLLIEINYHTLTIEVMAKTLNRLNGLLTVPELLVILRERKLDDPRLQELVWTRHAGEERAIFFHLMKAFELAKLSEEEIWLMQQYAVLPAMPIEVKTLADFLKQEPLNLNRSVNELNDKGWIGKMGRGLGMHRIVQEVVKYQKEPAIEELEQLVDAMANKMTTSEFGNPIIENLPWLEYAKKVADYFTSHTHLPEKAAILWNNLANVLSLAGDLNESTVLLKHVLVSYTYIYGTENLEVAGIKSNLALNYMDLGVFDLAAQLLEEALDSYIKNYGLKHIETALILGNLGEAHRAIGKYDQAKEELETALKIDIANFGDNHPRVATVQSNLANVLRVMGKYSQATKLYRKALTINIKYLGADHPTVSLGYLNLANVLSDKGNFKKAKSLAKKGLNINIKNFGNNHPRVASSRSTLGNILNHLGEASQAIELLTMALESNIQNFGENSFIVAQDLSNLADLLRKNGKPDEAAELYAKSLDINLLIYQSNHPFIAQGRSNLAVGYRAIGKLKEAKELLESALKSDINSFGEDHPNVARRQANLAMVFSDLGKGDLAMELMEKALKNIEQNHGRDHHEFAVNIWNRGIIFFRQRVYSQAKVDFEKALKIIEKTLGVNHPHNAAIVSWLDAVNEKLNPSS